MMESDVQMAAPDDEIDQEDIWKVIGAYFKQKGMVRQQLDSFDEFIQVTVQELVDNSDKHPIEIQTAEGKDTYHFGQIYLSKPTTVEPDGQPIPVTPHHARLRNLTYTAPLFIDIRRETTLAASAAADAADGEQQQPAPVREETYEKISIGKMPIMLRSKSCVLGEETKKGEQYRDAELAALGECSYDPGGYFVVNGSEKVLIAQERMANNHVYVFAKKQPSKYTFVAEIRSSIEMYMPASTMSIKMLAASQSRALGSTIYATIPYVQKDVPIVVLFRALGVVSDKEILQYICYDIDDREMTELLRPSLVEGATLRDRRAAVDFIAKRSVRSTTTREARVRHALEVLQNELLPHVAVGEASEQKKAFFIGYAVNRLLQVALGRRAEDDRDHYGNKRLDLAGPLLGGLFRVMFKRLRIDAQKALQRSINEGRLISIQEAVSERTISNQFKYSLATGNWALKGTVATRTGVSQVLNRLTFQSTLSHLRRLNTPIERSGKLAKPRQLHNTHWGMICPAETPEGQSCGLVKNLALMAYISVGSQHEPVFAYLEERNLENLEEVNEFKNIPSSTKVFLNGSWVGVHPNPEHIAAELRKLRQEGNISNETSVIHDVQARELRLYTDAGRCCRPLFLVDQQTMRLCITKSKIAELLDVDEGSWMALVASGLVELLDCMEEETAMIAMSRSDLAQMREAQQSGGIITKYTHCEIHPSMILGICGSIIPFPDHNQSPRNTYQCAMGKQAMGIYISNYPLRQDTMCHVLCYPQKPLVTTQAMEHMQFRNLPAGQNSVVAILCYSGYNQEDSVILNHSSVDRGFFRSLFFRSYQDELDKYKAEEYELPTRETTDRMKALKYDKLDADGLVPPGTRIAGDDIIIGKTVLSSEAQHQQQVAMQGGGGNAGEAVSAGAPVLRRRVDASIPVRSTERGVVDQVVITLSEQGCKLIKTRIRSVRIPQIGDKFSSRHGQKGTCGMLYKQEDMPFTLDGISPDIIMNPHAVPSRMTVAQLIECLLGKVTATAPVTGERGVSGGEGDGTPFQDELQVNIIGNEMHKHGYQRYGNERLYNGHTGRLLEAHVFIGPTYYQRLKHMVDDKIHSRARGPLQILTRQPVEGRARDGGLRFGEMERDCIISHGAAAFLKERLFEVSDQYRVYVCDNCGLFAIANVERPGTYECRACLNKARFSLVAIPYATKLLLQELMSMAIAPRIYTVKD
eukprot:m51a1_g7062 putative dna-directed rna polymerase ii subunit rpb2-like (1207) ;mRNA; f:172808-177135